MIKSDVPFFQKVKLIIIFLFLIICLITLYYLRASVIIALIGIGFGVILAPLLKIMRSKYNFPRALSSLICLFFIIFIIASVTYAASYLVSDQIKSLTEQAPEISANLKSQMSKLFQKYPWFHNQLVEFDMGKAAQDFVINFVDGIKISLKALTGFGFAIILGLYVAVALPDYYNSTVRAFPKSKRQKVRSVLSECASTLRLWFRTQLLVLIILGLITSLGLWIVGVKYWGIYGLLTALFCIIPYVGIIFIVFIATIITLASSPSLVPWVLLVFLITQQLEGNLVLPILMKDKVELPEAPLLICMLFLGSILGVIGIFLAPPIFAIGRVIYKEIYLPRVDEL